MEKYFSLDEEFLSPTDDIFDNIPEFQNDDDTLTFFRCDGNGGSGTVFNTSGFLSKQDIYLLFLINNNNINENDHKIFNLNIDTNVFIEPYTFQSIISKARMNIQKLDFAARNIHILCNESAFELRNDVTTFLKLTRLFMDEIETEKLNPIRILLGTMDSLPEYDFIQIETIEESPVYQLFHGHLDWRWILLTIQLKIDLKQLNKTDSLSNSLLGTEFEQQLKAYIYELMIISLRKFSKENISNLINTSPFPCLCIKESWLLIQLLLEKITQSYKIESFWFYFNHALNCILEGISVYEKTKTNDILLRNSKKHVCNNYPQFSIWLMSEISKLYGYSEKGVYCGTICIRIVENFEITEGIIKSFLNSGPSEENLRVIICNLMPIIIEWWSPKSDILLQFWEFFHKNLNSSFFIQGSSLSTLAVTSNTASGFLLQVKTLLNNEKLNYNNQTSYTMFVSILGKLFKKFLNLGQKNQVQKIMGRIYSKFPASKLIALNEMGIHNICTLLLTLALTADLNEVGQKIQDLLLIIPFNKITEKRQVNIIKGHVAMLLIYIERDINVQKYIQKIIEQINLLFENNERRDDSGISSVLKILAEGLHDIFSLTETYDLGQHLLLDSWIKKYFELSTVSEQERLMGTLNKTLMNIENNKIKTNLIDYDNINRKLLLDSFYKLILPFVKQAFSQNQTSINLPQLAGQLCLCCSDGQPKFEDLFKYFINLNCNSIQTTITFLSVIIKSDKYKTIDSTLIIQCWIKCSLLSLNNNQDLKTLTESVILLDDFKRICNIESTDLLNAKEPLHLFFAGIGRTYQSREEFNEKSEIIEKTFNYLSDFEKWTFQYINSSSSKEITIRIFIVIAIIIRDCSPIVYIRSRSLCFFNIAISVFIMPHALMIGKQLAVPITHAVYKIWHYLIEGISKLDYMTDVYLSKTLTDLIIKWTPHFKISNNPKDIARPFAFVLNRNSNKMSQFVFEKLASHFLILQGRQSHPHASLAITIIKEIVHSIIDDEVKLQLILSNNCRILLEHAMMSEDIVPSKIKIMELFEFIFKSLTYRASNDLKDIFILNLKNLTSKHLSYYTTNYYQLIFKLVKINPLLIQSILDHLKAQITTVEDIRGVGRDSHLRAPMEKLEGSILAAALKN